MYEENPQKLSDALERLGISKKRLSSIICISRPTLYKYIDLYDNGNRNKIPKDVLGVLLHLAEFADDDDVGEYLDRISERFADHYVPRDIVPLTANHRIYLAGNVPYCLSGEDFLDTFSKMDYEDALYTVKSLIDLRCIDMATKYFHPDSDPESSFVEGRMLYADLYTFFYMNMMSGIVGHPLISNSRYRDINSLGGHVRSALECSDYFLREELSDPRIDSKGILEELDYSDKDPNGQWYFAVYLYPFPKYLPGRVEMATDHFQAVDLQDAYDKALAVDHRDNPSSRAMTIVVFGPFVDLTESDSLESYVSIDWDSKFFMEHLPIAFGWLDKISNTSCSSILGDKISSIMHWVPFPEDFERFPEDTPDRFWPR